MSSPSNWNPPAWFVAFALGFGCLGPLGAHVLRLEGAANAIVYMMTLAAIFVLGWFCGVDIQRRGIKRLPRAGKQHD